MKKHISNFLTKTKLLPMMALWSFSQVSFADAIAGEVQKQPLNVAAIAMFFLFVMATLGITFGHPSKTKPPLTSIQQVGVFQVLKTDLPLQATICQRLHFWAFLPWYSPMATMVCCTPQAFWLVAVGAVFDCGAFA